MRIKEEDTSSEFTLPEDVKCMTHSSSIQDLTIKSFKRFYTAMKLSKTMENLQFFLKRIARDLKSKLDMK